MTDLFQFAFDTNRRHQRSLSFDALRKTRTGTAGLAVSTARSQGRRRDRARPSIFNQQQTPAVRRTPGVTFGSITVNSGPDERSGITYFRYTRTNSGKHELRRRQQHRQTSHSPAAPRRAKADE